MEFTTSEKSPSTLIVKGTIPSLCFGESSHWIHVSFYEINLYFHTISADLTSISSILSGIEVHLI